MHKKRKGWISYPQFPQYIHNFIHIGDAENQGKYELFTKLSTLSTFFGKVPGDKKNEKETNVLCLISKRGLFLLETAKNMDCKNKENNAFLSENKQEFTFPLFRTGYFMYNRKRQ